MICKSAHQAPTATLNFGLWWLPLVRPWQGMPAHCLVIVDILMHFEMMAMHSEVYYILLEIQSGRFFFAGTHWFPPDSGSRTIEPSSHKSQSQLHVGNQKCVEIVKFTDRQADANEGWRPTKKSLFVIPWLGLTGDQGGCTAAFWPTKIPLVCEKRSQKPAICTLSKSMVLKKMMVNHHRSSIVIFH